MSDWLLSGWAYLGMEEHEQQAKTLIFFQNCNFTVQSN
jgi:hypothetical protein